MHKPLSGLAALCLFACLSACDQTTSNAVSGLVNAGATIACAELSKGSTSLYRQCTDTAGLAIPVGQALAQGLVRKK